MHYYQFNIGDYSSHTKGLSLIEDLAYRRLIDEYYLAEHAFNGCSADVARLIGLRDNLQEVEYVLNRYFIKDGDSWHHGRIDSDIADYHQKQEKRSNAGKKSAEARKKATDVEQVLNECSAGVELTNNHKPLTNNQEPIKKNTSGKPLVTFASWIASLKESNTPVIEDDDPIFEYAKDAGIPRDFLLITWIEFKAEFSAKDKKQRDWRAHFRNFVRKNYYSLWWIDNGEYKLTTRGQQALAAMNNKDKREGQ